jgi:hypothetical protein
MLEASKFVFLTYRPPMPGDRRRGPRGMRRAEETLQARAAAEAAMDEAARQDATLAVAEAPLPQYFATDDESSSDDEEFVPAPETSSFQSPSVTRRRGRRLHVARPERG